MQVQKIIKETGENGFIEIDTDFPKGTLVEIIVLPIEGNSSANGQIVSNAFEKANLEAIFEDDKDLSVDWLEVFDVKNR
jgi:hypothetical protein